MVVSYSYAQNNFIIAFILTFTLRKYNARGHVTVTNGVPYEISTRLGRDQEVSKRTFTS
jgi:hypothetical protein